MTEAATRHAAPNHPQGRVSSSREDEIFDQAMGLAAVRTTSLEEALGSPELVDRLGGRTAQALAARSQEADPNAQIRRLVEARSRHQPKGRKRFISADLTREAELDQIERFMKEKKITSAPTAWADGAYPDPLGLA